MTPIPAPPRRMDVVAARYTAIREAVRARGVASLDDVLPAARRVGATRIDTQQSLLRMVERGELEVVEPGRRGAKQRTYRLKEEEGG